MNVKSQNPENRIAWMDITKVYCMTIVILNHLELHIPLVSFFGGMFYMPAFFVLAGLTYRSREEAFGQFMIKKAKRLLIPYFVCNLFLTAFFTVKNHEFVKTAWLGIFYSRNMLMRADSSWNCALMPYLNAPTWFLTCLFLSVGIYFLLDHGTRKAAHRVSLRRKAIIACMAVGILLHYLVPVLLPWSLENALYFLGLIEAGRFLWETGFSWLEKNQWIYANFFLAFVALSYMVGTVNVSVGIYGSSMILCFFTGLLGSILVMKAAMLTEKYLKVLVKPLAFAGRHTLTILCWHLFIIEIIRTILRAAGV